tara:strand:- start:24977 stop:26059 length:1083 start_codon:yes stop_codon:yes gene_type:complete
VSALLQSSSEVSWFSALCDDDYEFLGVRTPELQSSFEHCRKIVLHAEEGGYDNILLPSGYALGIDSIAFASAVAPLLRRMQLLVAVRCGEMWPPQLARQLATLNEMLAGRLTVNIISSDLPGETLDGPGRYARTLETMLILKDLMAGKPSSPERGFYNFDIPPPRITKGHKAPPFYFGGLSNEAREVAAQAADVFLMWPDRMENLRSILTDMRQRALKYGRTLRFGYRVHVIVRETEADAKAYARKLISKLDPETGDAIRKSSLDASSFGVRRQAEMRDEADTDGFVEDNLWTGIGRARSGCGAAIVGDPDQVLRKLEAYKALGFDAFILSGYPHVDECDLFARYVLPSINHAPLFGGSL